MYITSPACIGAGFAAAIALAAPFVVLSRQESSTGIFNVAVLKQEDRLTPSPLPDDGSNGCGLMKGVDICALDYVQTHMPQYLRK